MMIIFELDTTVPIFSQFVPGVHEAGRKNTPVETTEYVLAPALFGERVPWELLSSVAVALGLLNETIPDLSVTPAVCGSMVPST